MAKLTGVVISNHSGYRFIPLSDTGVRLMVTRTVGPQAMEVPQEEDISVFVGKVVDIETDNYDETWVYGVFVDQGDISISE